MQDRSTAVTRNLLEDSLSAGVAGPLVTDLRACVPSAFQHTATDPGTDMLSLKVLITWPQMRFELPADSLTLDGLLLAGTASLSAGVTATVQAGLANAEALRRFHLALRTHCCECVAPTTALNGHILEARPTRPGMADLGAWMSTGQRLSTRLGAIRDRILARCARRIASNLVQRCLSARAVKDHIRRPRTVSRMCILRMAALLAEMNTTIKGATALISTAKAASPFFNVVLPHQFTIQLFILRAAQHLSLYLSTVTACFDPLFTRVTQAFMTRPGTRMLSTR